MNVVTPHEPNASPTRRDAHRDATVAKHGSLATAWVALDLAAVSSCGRLHGVNEDWHSALDEGSPVFVVADGVGGGAMPSRASRELVRRVHAALHRGRVDGTALRAALLDADREVARSIADQTDALGAATVAVCASRGALLSRWFVAWVGDCRVYRVGATPDQTAQPLTVDDTYRQLSEQPPTGGSPDDPARMVGNGAVSCPNVTEVDLRHGEMLVLCSDGVHKHVDARDIGRLLRGKLPLVRRCMRLLALARVRGSVDDATVLVVRREVLAPGGRFAVLGSALSLALLVVLGVFLAPSSPRTELAPNREAALRATPASSSLPTARETPASTKAVFIDATNARDPAARPAPDER